MLCNCSWHDVKSLYSIGNLIYYRASGGAAAIAYLVCPETPKWADDALGESEDYFGNIAYALSHPVETIESMAQSTSDTYEKEGLTYMVSYVVADLLLGKALSGAGKADDVTDVAGVANKADDVADVAGDTRYYDDLDNLDDLDDYYDDIYDQYYKDQFDSVKDGAIADPGDIEVIVSKNDLNDLPSGVDSDSNKITRPTWRKSEDDVAKDFSDYGKQKSFKKRKPVAYGEKGSVRPDLCKKGSSIDVKNYDVESTSGRRNLAKNIEKQYYQRVKELPSGTKQSVVIDIRGQNVSNEELMALYKDIMKRTNNGIKVKFKTK